MHHSRKDKVTHFITFNLGWCGSHWPQQYFGFHSFTCLGWAVCLDEFVRGLPYYHLHVKARLFTLRLALAKTSSQFNFQRVIHLAMSLWVPLSSGFKSRDLHGLALGSRTMGHIGASLAGNRKLLRHRNMEQSLSIHLSILAPDL